MCIYTFSYPTLVVLSPLCSSIMNITLSYRFNFNMFRYSTNISIHPHSDPHPHPHPHLHTKFKLEHSHFNQKRKQTNTLYVISSLTLLLPMFKYPCCLTSELCTTYTDHTTKYTYVQLLSSTSGPMILSPYLVWHQFFLCSSRLSVLLSLFVLMLLWTNVATAIIMS